MYDVGLGLPWPEGVKFNLDLPAELPHAKCDPVRIRQVLLNLLSNALKFTKQGSVTLCARYVPDRAEVEIGVSDTGEGIPADKLDQLFQRYQQVDTDPQRRRKGVGLGLAISRELIEMHGGRIWVESRLGTGSSFLFALPLQAD
jgi:signal transduction histidine kinase